MEKQLLKSPNRFRNIYIVRYTDKRAAASAGAPL